MCIDYRLCATNEALVLSSTVVFFDSKVLPIHTAATCFGDTMRKKFCNLLSSKDAFYHLFLLCVSYS